MPDQTTPLANVVAQLIWPRPGHRLLFVFYEMMDQSVIRERCPDPIFICTARLTSRRFIVNSDGLASIVPRRDYMVHGIVWEVHDLRHDLSQPSAWSSQQLRPIWRVRAGPLRHTHRVRVLRDAKSTAWLCRFCAFTLDCVEVFIFEQRCRQAAEFSVVFDDQYARRSCCACPMITLLP